MQVNQTRIQPVGRYVPSAQTPAYYQPSQGPVVPAGVKDFAGDVWVGAREQFKSHGQKILNPIDTINRGLDTTPRQFVKRTLAPYKNDFKTGNYGRALGRVLANVATVGAVVLGARALFSKGLPNIGGGASVGYRGPIASLFHTVTGAVGNLFQGAGNIVRGVGSAVTAPFRWLLGGGGAGVGLG